MSNILQSVTILDIENMIEKLPNKPSNQDVYKLATDNTRLEEKWLGDMDAKTKWNALKIKHRLGRKKGVSTMKGHKLMGMNY